MKWLITKLINLLMKVKPLFNVKVKNHREETTRTHYKNSNNTINITINNYYNVVQ